MKRLAHKILTAALTFVVGVTLSLNWVAPLQTLPYCELARNAEKYHERMVRVRSAVGGESPTIYTIYQLECDPVEALASVVEIDQAAASEPEVRELWERLSAPTSEDTIREAEVVLSGRFDAHHSPGCWVPKFKISDATIEQIISVSEKRLPPPTDDVPLRIRH